ncbi:CCA tRNA nucleotidyltransferase [Alkalihalobacillus sp. 1P02AB]|uniref:CCA tRNA nucleotidyltransferase n=1 Tax=Alkalihalobacillus sp. 1P02AB TaxID=3132260 RepID=UPI0039A67AC5
MQELISAGQKLLQQLNEYGYRAFFVGGAVRDFYLKRTISDLDLVTSATPEQMLDLFPASFQMNNQHQTVLIKWDGYLFEVTSERGSSLEEDLQKRDFTINSLAMAKNQEIIDLFGAKSDLDKQVLRSIHPVERMTEDPLRMLRALRFQSELGFGLEGELANVITEHRELLQQVAIERIVKEIEKWICGSFFQKTIENKTNQNVLHALPLLSFTEKELTVLSTLNPLPNHDQSLIWSIIYYIKGWEHITAPKLPLAKVVIKEINKVLHFYDLRKELDWGFESLYDAGYPIAQKVEWLKESLGEPFIGEQSLKTKWHQLMIQDRSELAIDGKILLKEFEQKPGVWIEEYLRKAEYFVLTNQIKNEKEALIKELKGSFNR